MDKEELKNMANNPDFIPGIYNYCDRWCERCAYTANCYLFATEKRRFPNAESHDVRNEMFWEQMGEMFKITFELLEDAAEKFGIEPEEIDEEVWKRSEAEKQEQAENHPASQKARQYISKVNNWFEQSESLFQDKEDELNQIARLESDFEKVSGQSAGLADFVEVIRWYRHQIFVKIMRALRGKMDDFGMTEEDPIQTDFNGSAKVALLGVDRSIAAWGGLLKEFPENEDEIFPMLVLLEQIRNATEKEFSDARKFVRPGFDE